MIKFSVLYPHKPDARFDMAYYTGKHMPMVREKLGKACKGIAVDQGVAGGAPGEPPIYVAMGHVLFDSAAAMQVAMAPHEKTFMDDIPNYTNIKPVVQISDIKL